MTGFPFLVLATAFGMGVAFCGLPGVIFAEALRRGATRGFAAALTVELGSLVGDSVWAIIGLSGASLLLRVPHLQGIVGAVGGVLLAWLGLRAIHDMRRHDAAVAAPSAKGAARGDFAAGAALSFTNPNAPTFWLAIGAGINTLLGPTPRPIDYAVFFAGFMLACFGYCFIAAGIVAGSRQLLGGKRFRLVNGACGLLLLGFSAVLLHQSLTAFAAD